MKPLSKKLMLVLFFILSAICFLRLLRITIHTTSSPQNPNPTPLPITNTPTEEKLTQKEYNLVSSLISQRAPCNLLIFGLTSQALNLSKLNNGGPTVFLEDDAEKIRKLLPKANAAQIYEVKYNGRASEAFELLRHAREESACRPRVGELHKSYCKLALNQLPKEIYKRRWDVVVVDGPRGDQPETPGRMEAIYTTGVLARAGNMTDVFVHNTNRMIERWYSWEFLCQENLVISKGKLWHFQIKGSSSSTSFCQAAFRL